MVKMLTPLQQRIRSLLNEYEEHPQLQKILDIIEMLLNIPLRTSLAKVLILLLGYCVSRCVIRGLTLLL